MKLSQRISRNFDSKAGLHLDLCPKSPIFTSILHALYIVHQGVTLSQNNLVDRDSSNPFDLKWNCAKGFREILTLKRASISIYVQNRQFSIFRDLHVQCTFIFAQAKVIIREYFWRSGLIHEICSFRLHSPKIEFWVFCTHNNLQKLLAKASKMLSVHGI